jgi:poly(beta-D-mannuronate) lyase
MMHSARLFALLASGTLTVACANAVASDCPPPAPGLQDIKATGYYSDAAKSVRDPRKYQESHAQTKPFEDFATQVAKSSDRFLAKDDPAAATCTIAWLDRWAQDKAMLGTMIRINNDQAEYTRAWTNASAAIAWNKVRSQADTAQRARVDAWLKAVSVATLEYWRNKPTAKRNNHYYWTGVGVMATAVAASDADLLREARHIYEAGLADIRNDGTLKLEMEREVRALHYHNFAAMPLVMIAEMARKTGQNWFALRDSRLSLLVDRVATGLQDPTWFDKAAGASPQIIPAERDRAWMLIYRTRVPEDSLMASLPGTDSNGYIRDLGGTLPLMLAKGTFDAGH